MDYWQFSIVELVIVFYVFYNVVCCFVCLLLINVMVSFCICVMFDCVFFDDVVWLCYFDFVVFDMLSLVLVNVVCEILCMGDIVEQMLNNLMQIICGGDLLFGKDICKFDDDVDVFYIVIKLYLVRMLCEDLFECDSWCWVEIIELVINLEQVGDIIEYMFVVVQDKKILCSCLFFDIGLEEIGILYQQLVFNLCLGFLVFFNGDFDSVKCLCWVKQCFCLQEWCYVYVYVDCLYQQVVQSIEISLLYLDLISDMKCFNLLFCVIVYVVLDNLDVLSSVVDEGIWWDEDDWVDEVDDMILVLLVELVFVEE